MLKSMVIINNSEGQLQGCPTIEICFEKYLSKSFKKSVAIVSKIVYN